MSGGGVGVWRKGSLMLFGLWQVHRGSKLGVSKKVWEGHRVTDHGVSCGKEEENKYHHQVRSQSLVDDW